MSLHGGDIYRNQVYMDFSVNINPLGIPKQVKDALFHAVEDCQKYPDPETADLKKAVAASLEIPQEDLLFGNGASELFMAIVQGIRPETILIPVPSFYGYEHAARAVDARIVYVPFPKEEETWQQFLESYPAELLFLGNPNNPTGTQLGKEKLRDLLETCEKKKIYVVLDETFMDFCRENTSLLPELARYPQLLIVRAYTKSFAIAGVRLGYLACGNRSLLQQVKAQLPEWNVSVFAQAAGKACAESRKFLEKTVDYVEQERKFLGQGLKALGIRVLPGAANFLLFYSAIPLYRLLLQKGILIRDCSNFRGLGEGYYRIAVRSRRENEILLKEIGDCIADYTASETGRN